MAIANLTGGGTQAHGDGDWFPGLLTTNPADQAVLVDTAALAPGKYLAALIGYSTVAAIYDVQHRNAANTAGVNGPTGNPRTQRRAVAANLNDDWVLPNEFPIERGERLRVVLQGAIVGNIQVAIFLRVPSG